MKRVIQVYKAPEDWNGGAPGLGDFIRGACHLYELLYGSGIDFKIDLSQTDFFDLIEYDEAIFHIGDAAKIAQAETFYVDHNAVIRRINEFYASGDTDLYICTNLGNWDRTELPAKTTDFIRKFYRFNQVIERFNAAALKVPDYEVLSVRYGEFPGEKDMGGGNPRTKSRIFSIIQDHVLPNRSLPIVVTSDNHQLKCELAEEFGFLMLPHESKHGGYGGALPVVQDLQLLKGSKFNYHINAWASWWSGFSHYTSVIFNIPSMNFKAPDFARTDLPAADPSRAEAARTTDHDASLTPPGCEIDSSETLQPCPLPEAIGRALEKVRTGDMSGVKAECDRLLADGHINFYVYYLSGIVSSERHQWTLARKRFQKAMAVSTGMPGERVADAASRLAKLETL